jgi:hypothetical protein
MYIVNYAKLKKKVFLFIISTLPSCPGFSGIKSDTVGPMDYDPKPIEKPKTILFGKVSQFIYAYTLIYLLFNITM